MKLLTVRELDGHDLGDGDESCEVTGCDDHATHAVPGSGWVCARHAERVSELETCDVCGALTVGPCADDH